MQNQQAHIQPINWHHKKVIRLALAIPLLTLSLTFSAHAQTTQPAAQPADQDTPKTVTAQPSEKENQETAAPAATSTFPKNLPNFGSLRSEMLNLMGGAKQRIWINTNFLTDGEIVTALFLAKYRKIDARVLVDEKKANHYMSRVFDLTKNNVPVALFSANFPYKTSTYLLVDNKVYHIDSDLNHNVIRSSYRISAMTDHDASDYALAYNKALEKPPVLAIKSPPLVGKHGRTAPIRNKVDTPTVTRAASDGSYNYDLMSDGRKHRNIPAGVNTRLPKVPIYQKNAQINRQQQAIQQQPKETAPAASNTPELQPSAPVENATDATKNDLSNVPLP